MLSRGRPTLAVLLLAGAAAACGRAADDAPPVATPSVTLDAVSAPIGSPIEMQYRFVPAAGASALDEDYVVFVHFVDRDGELMWTDDHPPPVPTSQWRAGTPIEYTRTIFVPKFPYIGETHVEVGLYSPAGGQRLPLAGEADGDRAYRVASFTMRLQDNPVHLAYGEGWYDTEVVAEGNDREWRWSAGHATLSFRHPNRDVRLYLKLDQPVSAAFPEPQTVEIRAGDTVIDRFQVGPGAGEVRRVDIPSDRLGSADSVELTVSVDKTFVPASVPALRSSDRRELGIRVFHAYVEPL